MLAPQLKPTIDIDMLCFIISGVFGICIKTPCYYLQHGIGSCSIIICILMGSCSTPGKL